MAKFKAKNTSVINISIDGNKYSLKQGNEYEFPEENERVKSLIRNGYLEKSTESKGDKKESSQPEIKDETKKTN